MKNELWSCYRPVAKPQPLAALTSSSKAEKLYLLFLLVRRVTPHHREKLQKLHEGWWSSNKVLLHQSEDTHKLSNIWAAITFSVLQKCSSPVTSCRLIDQELKVFNHSSFGNPKHIFGKSTTNSHFSLWTKHYNLIFT